MMASSSTATATSSMEDNVCRQQQHQQPPQQQAQQRYQRVLLAGWWRWCTGVLTVLVVVRAAGAGGEGPGTTANLRQIFIGRCWDYQAVVNSVAFQSGKKNCTRLYEDFLSVFESRDPCNIQTNRYMDYTLSVSHSIPPNKSLFWIGVYHLVNRYSEKGRRFMTIADSLAGYLLDDLIWCGKHGGGINTESCPKYGTCDSENMMAFWRAASIQFADLARGTAYVMLNGTRGTAFTNNSVFATYELPNMNVGKVSTVHAYVIHDINKEPLESCADNNTSISRLKELVEDRGMAFECTDDPISVRLLQCVDYPRHRDCRLLNGVLANSAPAQETLAILFSLTSLSIVILWVCL